ncbi:BlaI/MecI/CopY family transcriptional regulator [Agaribacterium sp. ZY112]|uniref:BlaI/MecI/CopY family transcriptional regulator n=1 Tax=Agaribacterium sp. ZY112 TaxID=3233574 RepID=UPI003525F06F
MSNQLQNLSRRERQIMDVIFELEACSAQEVLERMPDPPSYSSVRALIARLVEKGVLDKRSEGTRHIYFAKISQGHVQGSALKRLVKTFFKGSAINAVSALLDLNDGELNKRELDELERKIKRLKSQNR